MAKVGTKAIDGNTELQRLFCTEYMLNGGNGQQAAIKVGYSAKTAAATASRLLTYVNVQYLIKELKQIDQDKAIVTKQEIAKELQKIGFSDIRKVFDANGNLLPVHEIPDDAASSLAGVDVDELYAGKDNIGQTKKVKMWDKLKALAQLTDLYGYNMPTKIASTNAAGDDVPIVGMIIK